MTKHHQFLFPCLSFLSSFLLFSIQPIMGQSLLPLFGGTASIWNSAMLFFLTFLLLGNLYALFLLRLKPQLQLIFQLFLTILSFIFLFFFSSYHLISPSPNLSIFITLSLRIGLPYLLLSTTTSLLQSRYHSLQKQSPYYLYSFSNLGALTGLFSSLLLFRPFLSLPLQLRFWTSLYTLTTLLIFFLFSLSQPVVSSKNNLPKLISTFATFNNWPTILFLALLPNLFLLSTTTYLSTYNTPQPVLWVIPLSLYLLSYIIGFSKYILPTHVLQLITLLTLTFQIILLSIFPQAPLSLFYFSTILSAFLACLTFNHELYLRRPTPSHLPFYYLLIAISGVLASILCTLLSPTIFTDIWEYPLTLSLGYASILLLLPRSLLAILFLLIPFLFTSLINQPKPLVQNRNYYGLTRVINTSNRKDLFIGQIHQGFQFFNDSEFVPTNYYGPETGIGQALNYHPTRLHPMPLKVGVIGLGVGTLAAYCQPEDDFIFYELDPQIINYAEKDFTYLNHCREISGKVSTIVGDARLSLENSPRQYFNLLVVDAFSGTSIPTHLLTTEAIQLYFSHLSEDGIVAIHLTNPILKLKPMLDSNSKSLNAYSFFHSRPDTSWYFIAPIPLSAPFPLLSPPNPTKPWSDNYSNLLTTMFN